MVEAKKGTTPAEKALLITKRVVIYFLMTVSAIIMLIPFYWAIITAIRPYDESMAIPLSFVAKEIILDNFKAFFESELTSGATFGSAVFYTALITAIGMFTNLFLGGLAGYTFARMEFRGRRTIFKIMLASLMIPSVVTMLPQYFIINGMGLIGNPLAVVLPGSVGVYGIFFTRQFFRGIPAAYGEAARLDGAGEFRIYWQIYLPQVSSGMITLGIITFNSYWNSYLWPKLVLPTSSEVTMLSLIVGQFTAMDPEIGQTMAASLVTMVPSLLVFAFLQKYFLNTVTFAGVKE